MRIHTYIPSGRRRPPCRDTKSLARLTTHRSPITVVGIHHGNILDVRFGYGLQPYRRSYAIRTLWCDPSGAARGPACGCGCGCGCATGSWQTIRYMHCTTTTCTCTCCCNLYRVLTAFSVVSCMTAVRDIYGSSHEYMAR